MQTCHEETTYDIENLNFDSISSTVTTTTTIAASNTGVDMELSSSMGSDITTNTAQTCHEETTYDIDNLNFDSISSTTTTTAAIAGIDMEFSSSMGSETTPTKAATTTRKPHAPSKDPYAEALHRAQSETAALNIDDLTFIQRLGSGDIGTVYLVELKSAGGCMFAAKVMDKEELESRNKEGRAGTEKEILQMLDHPFLPTLYANIDSHRWSCLLTEFCPGGDLHLLRQRQPGKRFGLADVRFYASEVVVALEYLHMLGIIYRDLKPENVLVRSDGHIMLTDFDLSLKCDDSKSTAQVVYDQNVSIYPVNPHPFPTSSCILPNCIAPAVSCFNPKPNRRRNRTATGHRRRGALEIVAEPIEARSMSFVGTHEYLAPEIVSGEGHGNAVDWWTLGIFMYELFYGVTPFRGNDNEFTLANIVARGLDFPKEPILAGPAKDLIAQLLAKDPAKRMGSTMGSTAIKHHPFFGGVNWALLRCMTPPYIPPPVNHHQEVVVDDCCGVGGSMEYY